MVGCRQRTWCWIVGVFLCVSVEAQTTRNALTNGGFEKGDGERAAAWMSGAWGKAKGVHRRVADAPHSGAYAYCLEHRGGGGGLQLFPSEWLVVPDARQTHYRVVVSGWHRGNKDDVRVQVRYARKEGDRLAALRNALGGSLCTPITLAPAKKWRAFKRRLTFPKRTDDLDEIYLNPYFLLTRPGRVCLDDIRVEVSRVEAPEERPEKERLYGDFSKLEWQALPTLAESADGAHWQMPALPPFRITAGDGIMLKDGKPFFLLGVHEGGGGQFGCSSIWFPRVFKYDFVETNCGISRAIWCRPEAGKRLLAGWKDLSWVGTWLREHYRNNTYVWLDVGSSGSMDKYLRRYKEFIPDLELLSQKRYGHFYPADHMHPLGRAFHRGHWQAWFKYAGDLPFVTAEIFNELGYWCTSPLTLNAFQDWMMAKYGSLDLMNRILKTNFTRRTDIAPPHIWERFDLGYEYNKYMLLQMKAYPDLWNDWLEFMRHNFAAYLKLMKEDFVKVADCPMSVDSRYSRIEDRFSYSMVDPELVDQVTDILSFHVTGYIFYDYQGRPAAAEHVMNSLIKPDHCHDYMRAAAKHPIVNPENIISSCRVPGLNTEELVGKSIVNLHTEWRFRTDPGNIGLRQGWHKEGYDDAAWDRIRVPGVWEDAKPEYKDYDGWAWYRIRFVMPSKYAWTAKDGSVRYLLYGKGLDDAGAIYLNGTEVHRARGWATVYQVNLNPHLRFGEENTLAIRINDTGLYGGLRFFVTLIGDTMAPSSKPLSKEHMAAMIWSNAVHGMSGMDIWDWGADMLRTCIPEIKTNLDSVSDVLLPRPRIKGSIAMFYSWESFSGLFRKPPQSADVMDYYGAMLFNRVPMDMITNRGFLRGDGSRYKVIVFPYCHYVRRGTFEKLKDYVARGGTAVLTYNSFLKDMHRYEPVPLGELLGLRIGEPLKDRRAVVYRGKEHVAMPGGYTEICGVELLDCTAEVLATFADGKPAVIVKPYGKGRLYYIAAELDFRALHGIMGDVIRAAGVLSPYEVTSENEDEFPYIETQVIGDRDRFLLYLLNWGGLTHPVRARLTDAWLHDADARYRVRHVQNRAWENQGRTFSVPELREGLRLDLSSYQPQVLLFESTDVESRIRLRSVSGKRTTIMRRFDEMKQASPPASKPKAVFLKKVPAGQLFGRDTHPLVVQILEQEGFGVHQIAGETLTARGLKDAKLLFLSEDQSLSYKGRIRPANPAFFGEVRKYVENGGCLLLCASATVHYNATNFLIRQMFARPRRVRDTGGWCTDPASSRFGDPNQLTIRKFADHPLTGHVRALQFMICTTLTTEDSNLVPVAFTADTDLHKPSQPVAVAGALGKGKIVIVMDSSWTQPFRIEHADNAQFLFNCINWLTDRPTHKIDKQKLVSSLFITEAIMQAIEREEAW